MKQIIYLIMTILLLSFVYAAPGDYLYSVDLGDYNASGYDPAWTYLGIDRPNPNSTAIKGSLGLNISEVSAFKYAVENLTGNITTRFYMFFDGNDANQNRYGDAGVLFGACPTIQYRTSNPWEWVIHDGSSYVNSNVTSGNNSWSKFEIESYAFNKTAILWINDTWIYTWDNCNTSNMSYNYMDCDSYECYMDGFDVWEGTLADDPTEGTTSTFQIRINSTYTGSPISIFNATIDQNATYQTTNGTIITPLLPNSSILHNFSLFAYRHDNANYSEYNISTNLFAQMNYSFYLANFTAFDNVTATAISNYYITVSTSDDDQEQETTNGTVLLDMLKNREYTITINSSGYSPKSIIETINHAIQNISFDLYYSTWVGILECNGSIANASVNFTINDEDYENQLLASDVNGYFEVTDYDDITTNNTFNFSDTESFKVCIYPPEKTYYANMYLEYEVPLGYKERYYFFNATLTNTTTFINLYNFNTTADSNVLEGTLLKEDSYLEFSGVTAKLRRFYPESAEWRQVQVDRSDEQGNVFFYIKERSTLYDIVFEKDGVLLYTTSSMKFQCDATTSICEVTFKVPDVSTAAAATNINLNITYNNATEVVTVNWNDPTGVTQQVRVEITQETPRGITTWLNDTSTSASGSITFNTSAIDGTIKVVAYSTQSPELPRIIKYIEKLSRQLWDTVSQNLEDGMMETAFWGLGTMVTLVGATLWSPVAVVFSIVFGLILAYFLQLFNWLTLAGLTVIGIIAIIMSMKLRG